MQKILEELINSFKEEQVVQRIIESEDKLETFRSIQKRYKTQLKQLREGARDKKRINSPISVKNAVTIGTIYLMAEIGDSDLFENRMELYDSLQQVKGPEEHTAMKMAKHLLFAGIRLSKKSSQDLVLTFY